MELQGASTAMGLHLGVPDEPHADLGALQSLGCRLEG